MINLKKGSTLALEVQYSDDSNVPSDVTGVTITADMVLFSSRSSFAVTKLDQVAQPGAFTLTIADTVTALLNPGVYQCDLKFVDSGIVSHTETFEVKVTEAITQ